MTWAYGVTTTPARLNTLFPRTLKSLASAGFGQPHIFIDGSGPTGEVDYRVFNLPVTLHHTPVHAYPAWVLAAFELYFRNIEADYYALFQDDLVLVKNLREYLERKPWPSKGYLNLFSFMENEEIIKNKAIGWYEAYTLQQPQGNWQAGRGALALVFSQEAIVDLLDSGYIAHRFVENMGRDKGPPKNGLPRGFTHIDGAVVTCMNKMGWREYIHAPSLVQHTGVKSTMGSCEMPLAYTFPSEEFDALTLL